MKHYPEIQILKEFIKENQVSVSVLASKSSESRLIPVELKINRLTLKIYIDDEFKDLKLNNSLLNVILALRELSFLDDSQDFLQWIAWCNEDASNPFLLDYYKTICSKLHLVKDFFNDDEIDYFVSDLDFQLNSGCVQELRRSQTN